MRKAVNSIIVAISTFLLVACGTTSISNKAFDPASQSIKSVAITEIKTPGYMAMDWGNPAGLFAAKKMTNQSNTYQEAIKKQNPQLDKVFETALTKKLGMKGVEAQIIPLKTDNPFQLSEEFLPVAGADSYLNIVVEYIGYTTYNAFDRDFKPDLRVKVQLVSTKSKEVLYSEKFMYGYHNPFMKATNIDAPKVNYYKKFDDLMADQKGSIDRLKLGIETVADAIVSNIKP